MSQQVDRYWLSICDAVASNSKCLSRKLGAVITTADSRFIISTGYNGPPSGCFHCDDPMYRGRIYNMYYGPNNPGEWDRLDDITQCPRKHLGFKSGEGMEYCQAAHAEVNAINTAARLGHSTENGILYFNWIIPCVECCKSIINAGIKRVIVKKYQVYDKNGLTGLYLLNTSGVQVKEMEA